MLQRLSFSSLVIALVAGSALAQVTATYAPFGSGCPGTGTGLGAQNVLPANMANAFGASDNSIPFTWRPIKYQQVFLGAELPTAFTMAGVSLRQNERLPVAHGITVDLEIQVGFTTRTPQTMSTTFAANFDNGAPVVVLPRTLVIFPDQPATPTDPAEFFMTIPWLATFAWAPAAGRNFLIQVTVFGNSFGSQIWGYPLDATWGNTGRLYGEPANATTGTMEPGSYGLVMSFRALTNTAVPSLYSTSTPQIGDSFRVRLSQARASSQALLLFGVSDAAWGAFPLPMELGWLGAPGCSLLTSIELAQATSVNASGAGSFAFDVPNNIYLLGGRFYNQFLVADPTVNPLGFVLSNGGVGMIGNQ